MMLDRLQGGRLSSSALTAAGVAVGYLALALPEGGFAPKVVATATILVWWAALAALIVRRGRAEVPRGALVCGAALAALALLGAVSLAWASDDGRGFVEVIRAAGYVGLFTLVIVAVPRGGSRPWLVGLTIGLGAVALLALGSRFIPALPGDGSIGSTPVGAQGRLSYPIGYWNGLAACMVLGAVLATWLVASAATRLGRALAVAALPLFGLSLYLTSSRGGVAVCVIALAALIAAGPSRPRLLAAVGLGAIGSVGLVLLARIEPDLIKDAGTAAADTHGTVMTGATIVVVVAVGLAWYLVDGALGRITAPPRRVVRGALAVAAVAALVGVVASDPVAQLEKFDDAPSAADTRAGARFTSTSGSGRAQYWQTAIDAFEEHPLRGLGVGGFQSFWDRNGSTDFVARHAHSAYFETLAELGLPGLLLLASFIAAALVAGLRRRAGSPKGDAAVCLVVLGAGCLTAAIEWTWQLPGAFAPVILAAALLSGRATTTREAGAEAPADREGVAGSRAAVQPRRLGWGLAALTYGSVAICAAAVLLIAEAKLDDSRDAFDQGDLGAAAQAAFDAGRIEPWASGPHLQLALVKEAEGDLRAARGELADARRLAPDDWRPAVITARVAESQGRPHDAGQAIERARRLNPRLLETTGGPGKRPEQARREVRRVALIDAKDFDPQGIPAGEEHSETVSLAIDADPLNTAWSTEIYDTEVFSGLKQGVGIYVTLSDVATPETIRVSSPAPGWSADLYAARGDQVPTTLGGWGRPLSSIEDAPARTRLELSGADRSRFVLLWLTRLAPAPNASEGYSAVISDIRLRGRPGRGS